jgi:segregation and condensation protein B
MIKKMNLENIIESLLLVAEKPVSVKELSLASGSMTSEVLAALAKLTEHYQDRGLNIIKKGDYFSMVTAPTNSEYVAKFLNEELRHDISEAALETLSIITYKQPITRAEIEEVRGVNSDSIVRNLMIRGLISEVGRKESPGRPILYGTTMEFLQYFGISGHHELPTVEVTENQRELFKKDLTENDEA